MKPEFKKQLIEIQNGLVDARKNKGLTQKQLAEKVGVSPRLISKIERDLGCAPLDTLYDMADALDKPLIVSVR